MDSEFSDHLSVSSSEGSSSSSSVFRHLKHCEISLIGDDQVERDDSAAAGSNDDKDSILPVIPLQGGAFFKGLVLPNSPQGGNTMLAGTLHLPDGTTYESDHFTLNNPNNHDAPTMAKGLTGGTLSMGQKLYRGELHEGLPHGFGGLYRPVVVDDNDEWPAEAGPDESVVVLGTVKGGACWVQYGYFDHGELVKHAMSPAILQEGVERMVQERAQMDDILDWDRPGLDAALDVIDEALEDAGYDWETNEYHPQQARGWRHELRRMGQWALMSLVIVWAVYHASTQSDNHSHDHPDHVYWQNQMQMKMIKSWRAKAFIM